MNCAIAGSTRPDDQLSFTADLPGAQTLTVDGFSMVGALCSRHQQSPAAGLPDWRLASSAPAGAGSSACRRNSTPGAASQFLAVLTSPGAPPKRIAAPLASDVRSTTNGADWIIISHADFLPQAQRLANYRASHDGFRTAVIDVAELYEQFNAGIFHPEAIRQFVAYAAQNWQPPAPQYIVLMGDGNWNFKGDGVDVYGAPDPTGSPLPGVGGPVAGRGRQRQRLCEPG